MAADESNASVFTAMQTIARKLVKAGHTPSKVMTLAGRETGWFFTIPLTEFRWRIGARRRASRPLTDAERESRRGRLARARAARVSL